ncbi:MAG: tail fiber protein [Bacteroidota bacterium]
MSRSLAFFIIFISSFIHSFAQVGINSNGTNPDPSAMLDVKSNTKGMLIPRMTAVERQTILDPAQGLMVFDQTNNAFYYFNGIGWLELLAGTVTELKDVNGDTKIQVEETADDDIIRFDIEGVEHFRMEQNRFEVVNNNDNIFIGQDAGESNTSGAGNTAIGNNSLTSNEGGLSNLAMGTASLEQNIGGNRNVALGTATLRFNMNGGDNIGIGNTAGLNNENGDHNILIGGFAGYGLSPHDKSNNVMIGHRSGESNEGDGNVFLGYQSGSKASASSNKLYIENSDTNSPLIYGEFDNNLVRINGDLQVTGSVPTSNAVTDDDYDTKILVEESADDDIIRFDIEGVERIKMEQNRIEVINNNDNIFIGENSGTSNASGIGNIGIGTSTLDSISSANHNIALGKDVLKSNTTGKANFGAGDQTLLKNTSGRQNIAIGVRAMMDNTTGRDNVGLGYFVLNDNTSGNHNVALGNFALRTNTTGTQNMGVGNLSLTGNTTGDNNSAFGNLSLRYNTTGDNNSAFGHQSLNENIEGNGNSALGYSSDVLSSNLRKATAIGTEAKVGCDNCLVLGEIDSISVGIGTSFPDEKLHIVGNLKMVDGNQQDGHVLTSDADGKATWQSLGSITDNQMLSFDGMNLSIEDGNSIDISGVNTVQDEISDGDDDTKIQVEEGNNDDAIRFDIAGTEFMKISDGIIEVFNNDNVFIGQAAGNSTATGGGNIALGTLTLDSLTTGTKNVAIGKEALKSNSTGDGNIAIGDRSMIKNISGDENIVLGRDALASNIDGSNNISLGRFSLERNTSGDDNVALGDFALNRNTTGDRNIGIGDSALDSNTSGERNIALGDGPLSGNKTGHDNIAIGFSSLFSITTGSDNIGIGRGTSTNGGAGSRNILIGSEARAVSVNVNDVVAIGAGTRVSQDSTIILGNGYDVGIGTMTPDEKLHIVGNIKIEDGNEQSGYILTSDASGVGTWQEKQDLDEQMLSFDDTSITISNGNTIDISDIDTNTDTDNQEIDFNSSNNVLIIENGNSVDLSSINTDEQTLSYNDTDQSITISGGNTVDLTQLAVPVGAMMMWYTSAPPDGWLICDGTTFNATTYPALNTVLGGNTLPDLIGRFALGSGERNEGSNHPLTSTGGIETVVLNVQNIPAHTHDVTIGFREGHENGQGQDYSDLGASAPDHNANKTYQTDSWGGVTGNPNLTLPHQNMPPFLTVNYIIKAK